MLTTNFKRLLNDLLCDPRIGQLHGEKNPEQQNKQESSIPTIEILTQVHPPPKPS